MLGMDASVEMGPTEGAVLALLDFLVDPLLPARSSSREAITPAQEELVAKQVHAVVLLYNYYHRKQHLDLDFLDFQSFCKLAVVLKPSLQSYCTLMERTDYAELDDLDKHLSLTEKAIMNACDTARSLDASNNKPDIEGWPVTKVAVFLFDPRRENCYLFHGSITKGVWSAIEKEVNAPSQGSEAVNKKTRVIKKASKENQTADETVLRQLAYIAVKETCGINYCDLKILENHLVYSTSKEKTAVRLYIMQCRQTNLNVDLVPINDVMDSLHGPLVRKGSSSWIFTSVVEYFHLLPFSDKLSDCLAREIPLGSPQHFEETKEDGKQQSDAGAEYEYFSGFPSLEDPLLNISESMEATKEVRNGRRHHLKEDGIQYVSQGSEALDVFPNVSSFNINKEPPPSNSQHPEAGQVVKNDSGYRRRGDHVEPVVYKKRNKSIKNNSSKNPGGKTTNAPTDFPRQSNYQSIVVADFPITSSREHDVAGTSSGNGFADIVMPHQDGKQNCVSSEADFKHFRKFQLAIASKDKLISNTALSVLLRKREQLSLQVRSFEDEIAVCDRSIQTILSGGEDDLAVKIDSILDGCNENCLRTVGAAGDKASLHLEDQGLASIGKRRRLSEANMCTQSPCQELDGLCNANFWFLPTYCLSTSEGGFQATVTLKGIDFECSSEGTIQTNPCEARNSAASNILVKLRSMQAES
ncbi:hypothetical protein SOVF_200720 isoform A [Spinacia oleracea]|uniref:Uncharacterized protein isoform X2 n=1 Tax=Spinacia oleracea TaxID=3562 RepID=A0A9R0JWU3_SPIOL|nr:uncharacterized protein LOC110789104 isoform X2 [Spinacia oleracea]KNA04324.1 hypothetical protein SOVF_200720 isoform A [Spinacia oleracea]